MNNINIRKLREDLIDYFGISMFSVSGFAIMDIIEIENASDEKLIEIARKNGFDLNNYQRNKYLKLNI